MPNEYVAKSALCGAAVYELEVLVAGGLSMRETPEYLADIFIRNSNVTRREFADLVEYALRDNTAEDSGNYAALMPPRLKDLLPRKYLH